MDDERTARAPGDPGPELRQRAEAQLRQRPGASADRVPADAAVERVLHELEVHQIELEMQNEELRRTQAALEMSRAKYFDLYDLAPVGYLTLSDTGLILEANLTAATLLGVDRGALRRQPLTRFLVPEDQDRYYVCRKRLLARGQPQTCELRMVRQDGSSLWVGLNATVGPGGDDAEPVCRVTLSDITDRKQAEETTRLKEQLEAENAYLRTATQAQPSDIVGTSSGLAAVLSQVEHVAATDAAVLLLGETGTGKELVAQLIHRRSRRKDRVMVTVNCAALPPTLIEAELFGREKGAYTGALTRQAGRFELAHGSTIFLDEIAELPLELQGKLLRVLEDGQLERVGSTKTLSVDVRLIAATNRDLPKRVAQGAFREDLYYRLNVFPIAVPPLRERREDIPLLVWTFARQYGTAFGKPVERIPQATMDALRAYPWPGNIRELRNVIERAVILSHGSTLRVSLTPTPGLVPDPPTTLDAVERQHIAAVLQKTAWRIRGVDGAARLLGVKPTTLESRIKKLGLQRPR